MSRAFETSRSVLKQYRSFLCAAAVAAFAVCLTPSVSAQTYVPSTVSCLSGGNYQAPDADPADPTPTNPAELDAESINSTVYKVSCTWSGFGTGITTTNMTMHVLMDYGSNIGSGPNGNHCIGGSAKVTGGDVTWHATCNSGPSGATGTISAGTDLSTIRVTGEVQTSSSNPVGTDDEASLGISDIYITTP